MGKSRPGRMLEIRSILCKCRIIIAQHFRSAREKMTQNPQSSVYQIGHLYKGIAPDNLGAILEADFGIVVRAGLQCAPPVHKDPRPVAARRRSVQLRPVQHAGRHRRRSKSNAVGATYLIGSFRSVHPLYSNVIRDLFCPGMKLENR